MFRDAANFDKDLTGWRPLNLERLLDFCFGTLGMPGAGASCLGASDRCAPRYCRPQPPAGAAVPLGRALAVARHAYALEATPAQGQPGGSVARLCGAAIPAHSCAKILLDPSP
eukprot:g30390.t1